MKTLYVQTQRSSAIELATAWAWSRAPLLRAPELHVLLCLAHNSDEYGECLLPLKSIAIRTRLCQATVKAAINACREKGLLSVQENWSDDGGRRANTYILNLQGA